MKALTKNETLKDVPEETLAAAFSDITERVINAPTIVGFKPVVDVQGNAATVRWSTDKKTTGLVSFAKEADFKPSTDKPYTTTVVDTEKITSIHALELTNLDPGTLYHFQVASKGEIGPEGKSNDYTFTTEAILPIISEAKIDTVTESAVTMKWKTNIPTAATLEYTNTNDKTTLTIGDTSFITNHSFTVSGLTSGAPYNLVIKAKNESNNEVVSQVFHFTTTIDTAPPILTNISSNSTLYPGQASKVQTIVSWETNKPATSQVFFQEGASSSSIFIASSTFDTSLTEKHIVVLTNFKPGTVYRYWIQSQDASNNLSKSDNFTILTPIEKKTIIDIIGNNFQSVFGWTKNVGL